MAANLRFFGGPAPVVGAYYTDGDGQVSPFCLAG